MKRFALLVLLSLSLGLPAAMATPLGLRYPALSPDGRQLAFSFRGDIWISPASGGAARRLTIHLAHETRPIWTRDGQRLVYTSNRYGSNDVFVISATGGIARRLTFSAANDVATSISHDGKSVIFQSNRENGSSLYRVPIVGGRPTRLVGALWNIVGHAAASNVSQRLLFTTSYESVYFSARKGYRGSNSSNIWRREPNGKITRLLAGRENELWPMWGAGEDRFYYVSDKLNRTFNIHLYRSGKSTPLTRFSSGHVRRPSIDYRGKSIVFERNFALWKLDLPSGTPQRLSIQLLDSEKQNSQVRVNVDGKIAGFALSPDGKKIAVVAGGNIFVTALGGGYSRRLTSGPWRRKQLAWAPDSRTLAYVSDKPGINSLFMVNADGNSKPRLVKSGDDEVYQPRFSPDGKWLSYLYGKLELRVRKVAGGGDRLVQKDLLGGRFAWSYSWSPDSKWIAYTQINRFSGEILLKEVFGKRKLNLTRNGYSDFAPRFSKNGKKVMFTANRYGHKWPYHTGRYDVYLLSLQRTKLHFKEDRFDRLFRSARSKKTAKKNKPKTSGKTLQIDEQDLEKRVVLLAASKGDDWSPLQSPKNSKLFVYVSNVMGGKNLFSVQLSKQGKRKGRKQITRGLKLSQIAFHPGGKVVIGLSGGRLYKISLSSKKASRIAIQGHVIVERQATYLQMFLEIWSQLNHYFYDKTMHSADWKGLKKKFLPVVKQLRTAKGFQNVMSELVGFLNASHTSVRTRSTQRVRRPAGCLGLDFEADSWRIKRVLRGGPTHRAHQEDLRGWTVKKVEKTELGDNTNLSQLLQGKIGKRVRITVEKGGRSLTIAVRPTTYGRERRLRYAEWERERKAIVTRLGKGNIGYVHLPYMGHGDYRKFHKAFEYDLAGKKGVVIDLRFNHGGHVHDQVLALLKKQIYATWTIRGMNRTTQPFYALRNKPIVLLINEVTLSDGEMTAHGFKELKLGTIIGTPTYGWLIFTTNVNTLWGARYRLPFWGCYSLGGENLERNGGVKPDIVVVNSLSDRIAGKDRQLEAAIRHIFTKIKQRPR